MRGRALILILGLALSLPVAAQQGVQHPPVVAMKSAPVPVPPRPLDLQTCFELAVLQSETLGMREEDIKIAQARYWQAVGSIFPKVHLLASERVQNSASGGGSSGVIDSGGGDTEFFSGGGGKKDSYQARINVKQPLFTGFREFNTAAASSAEIQARKHDEARTHQLLYLDVADVFQQILLYEADARLLKEISKALEERIVELDKWVRLGKSRPGELLMAKSDLADLRVTIEQNRGLLGASRELMSFLLGIPADSIRLEDKQRLPSAEALEAYLQNSGDRPDILAAIEMERSARRQLSVAKGEHWPTINAEGNYYLTERPKSTREWNIFLTFDLPIFEGGVIESRVSEHKALVRSSELNLAQLRRTANRDIRVAYNDFISAAAQTARLHEAVRLAGENLRVQSSDYKLGIVTNLDVLTALRQKLETNRRFLEARAEAKINLVRLHVAAGREVPGPEGVVSP